MPLAQRLRRRIDELSGTEVAFGQLDITFHRDDVHVRGGEAPRHPQPLVRSTTLDFPLEGMTVVLVDDVLYTGRTIRAAIEALFGYGRPERVQLAVLVDRGHRELPIRPDYVGKNLPTARDERIQVQLVEVDEIDRVLLVTEGDLMGEIHVMREGFLPPKQPPRRHLISIGDLEREDVERLLATAKSFSRSLEREVKKLPTLRGRTVVNVFYESSTRTSSSFELAAKRLSADTMSIKAAGSSVDKGESLKDTALTLGAYDPDVIVIRHPQIGAPQLVARYTDAHVVNAGDGKHQHPTQALLDLYTIQDELGRIDGRPRGDRRRRPPLAGRALEHPGAGADGRAGDARRAAAADPARDRGDGLRGLARDRRDRRRRRRLRPAHAARADGRGRQLRALACASTPRAGA